MMRLAAILLHLCLVSVAQGFAYRPLAQIPGKRITPDHDVSRNPRIVGGVEANIEDVPYQVSLRYCSPRTGECGHFCGGSIINADTILSAAHCIYGDDPETLWIRAGSAMRSTGGQVIKVRNYTLHPGYDDDEMFDDIAVLKLVTKLSFGNKVMPIGLPPRGYSLSKGTELLVSGWGDLVFDGDDSERLRKVLVPYVPNEICSKTYDYIRPSSICAGRTGKDACQGDSGGPLVHKKFVVGVVSGGDYCGYEEYPGTYARVSEFLDFIAEAMKG